MREYGLVINPGSTSTKLGVFRGDEPVFSRTIRHSQGELAGFASIVSQKEYRTELILRALKEEGIAIRELEGIISIGGLIRPGDAGVYRVDDAMLRDLSAARYNEHAANLGALIASEIAGRAELPACYVADPITTDELQPVARISGMPEITRMGRSHTLNQKSVAAKAAEDIGIPYSRARLVVAHLGGGISVTAHRDGRMVDTNNARGEGPFCIDRAGGLNSFELVKLCFSGNYTRAEMLKKVNGEGGVVAYLNTRDFREVTERRARGDRLAGQVFDAMAYQIAKEIAAMTVPLNGPAHAVVLTGGMANSEELVKAISDQVSYLAQVLVYPGERELEALADYLKKIAAGTLVPRVYGEDEKGGTCVS